MTVADRLRAIVRELPAGAAITLPAEALREWLADEPATTTAPVVAAVEPASWRERLWSCAAEVMLGVHDVAEALDRSSDWVYRAANAKRSAKRGRNPLPCQRLDGVLVFTAGAVRRWVQSSSLTVNAEAPGLALVEPRRLRSSKR